MVASSLAKQTENFFEDLTSDEAKRAALRTTSVRARAREELDEFEKLNNLPSPSNPNESAAFEKLYLSVGNDAEELKEANTRYRDESKAQLQNFLISSSPELRDLSVKQKNLLATERSGEEKNRVRATAFKTFVDLGIEPRKAETLAATVDWTPILGDVSGFEDAIVSYKNGNMGWAAFETTLGIIGLAPIVGDVIRKGFKTIGGKPNLDFEYVTPEGVSVSIPKEDLIGTKNEMFAGESSELAESRKGPFDVEKDRLFLSTLETSGIDVSAIKPRVLEGLDSSKQMWEDFKIQLKEENGIDLNTFKGAGSGSSGNIIADIKSMDNLTKAKVKAKLNEMWVKTGWTVGSKNKFFTEIDDSTIIRDADKNFDFEKFSYQAKFPKETRPLIKLGEVLDHPELYKAYPQLKNIGIRFDNVLEGSETANYSGYYDGSQTYRRQTTLSPEGSTTVNTNSAAIVMSRKHNNPEDLLNKNLTDIESGRRAFVSTLLHEIQHAIQHIEFQNAGATWAWQKDNSKKLLNNIDTAVKNIDKELSVPLSPKRQEALIAKKLDLQFNSDKIKSMDLQNNPKSGIDTYYKTQKEVEARNVQERAFDDMNERYNKSPYDTLTTYAKGINGEEIIRRAATDNYGVLDKQKYRDLMDKFQEVSNIEGYNRETTYSLLYKKRPYAEYQVNSPAYPEVKIGGVSIKGTAEVYAVPQPPIYKDLQLDYDTTYKALESGHNFISDLLRQETAKLTTIPRKATKLQSSKNPYLAQYLGYSGGAYGLNSPNLENIKTDDAFYNKILNYLDKEANTRKFPMEIEESIDYDITGLKGDGTDDVFPEVTEKTIGKQSNFEVLPNASVKPPTKEEPGIITFHGSKFDFNKFELNMIGTGEGSQSFGYGLYFTDREDIAKFYKEALSDELLDVKINDVSVDDMNLSNAAKNMIKDRALASETFRKGSISDYFEKRVQKNKDDVVYKEIVNAGIKEKDLEPIYGGTLYKTKLKVEPDEFLDNDKLLKEQPIFNTFQTKLNETYDSEVFFKQLGLDLDVATGRSLIESLEGIVRNEVSQKNAAEFLLKNGIKGIKYQAGQLTPKAITKGKEKGTNYVVFDDKIINILEKYGVVGAVGISAIGAGVAAKSGLMSRTDNEPRTI